MASGAMQGCARKSQPYGATRRLCIERLAGTKKKRPPSQKAEGAKVVVSIKAGPRLYFATGGNATLRPHTCPSGRLNFVEQLGQAYAVGTSSRALCVAFSISTPKLEALIRQHGWTPRTEGLWAPGKTAAERAAEVRAAKAARERELYADAVDDVRLLRSRGYVVVREGERCRVGNQLVTLAALRAKAAGERRLAAFAGSASIPAAPASTPCSIGGGRDGAGGLACDHDRDPPRRTRLGRLRPERPALVGDLPERPPRRPRGP